MAQYAIKLGNPSRNGVKLPFPQAADAGNDGYLIDYSYPESRAPEGGDEIFLFGSHKSGSAGLFANSACVRIGAAESIPGALGHDALLWVRPCLVAAPAVPFSEISVISDRLSELAEQMRDAGHIKPVKLSEGEAQPMRRLLLNFIAG